MSIRRLHVQCFLFLVFLSLFAAGTASAQSRIGVRAGISANPEQVYFGAHADLAEVVEHFWFRPNLEIGVGESSTLAAFNGEFVYELRAQKNEWIPYLGGGPGLVVRSFRAGANRDRNTDVGPGFNFVGGLHKTKGMLAEIKVGMLDSPSFKLGIGWTW